MNPGRPFSADYYDGHSSARHRVEVVVHGASLIVRGGDVLREYALADARVQPRVGELPLRIALPEGALLVAEAAAVAQAFPLPRATGIAHALESHLGVVVASMAGLVVAGWFGYTAGVPWLARQIAFHLSPALEAQIATQGMNTLDRYVFKPSKMDAERRSRLRLKYAELASGLGPAARDSHLEFRNGGWIGANAFAMPGGVVVVTDQLGAIVDDEHMLAVLAHELGHLEYRHGTRNMLQDSIVGLVSMALYGDAHAVAGLAATLPTVMLHTGYSRDFEREADQFAFRLLKSTGRQPRLLGEALARLERARDADPEDCPAPADGKAPKRDQRATRPRMEVGYLSTHPATEERIRAAEQASR